MAGQRIATLEIGFEFATGNLTLETAKATGAVDTMTATVLRSLERIDQRTGTLGDMSEPIKGINRYATAVETSSISIQREKNRIESAGERMVSQLERESAAFGKSSGELRNMRDAFGEVGGAIGNALTAITAYGVEEARLAKEREKAGADQHRLDQLARETAENHLSGAIELTDAFKRMFKEHSAGARTMEAAEKALTLVQLARTAVAVAEGAAQMFASLGPLGFPAVAAMLGVMAAVGFSGHGGGTSATDYTKANEGRGTVLGDPDAKSASIKNAIMRAELADMKQQLMTALATIAANTGRTAKKLDDYSEASGGDAIRIAVAA